MILAVLLLARAVTFVSAYGISFSRMKGLPGPDKWQIVNPAVAYGSPDNREASSDSGSAFTIPPNPNLSPRLLEDLCYVLNDPSNNIATVKLRSSSDDGVRAPPAIAFFTGNEGCQASSAVVVARLYDIIDAKQIINMRKVYSDIANYITGSNDHGNIEQRITYWQPLDRKIEKNRGIATDLEPPDQFWWTFAKLKPGDITIKDIFGDWFTRYDTISVQDLVAENFRKDQPIPSYDLYGKNTRTPTAGRPMRLQRLKRQGIASTNNQMNGPVAPEKRLTGLGLNVVYGPDALDNERSGVKPVLNPPSKTSLALGGSYYITPEGETIKRKPWQKLGRKVEYEKDIPEPAWRSESAAGIRANEELKALKQQEEALRSQPVEAEQSIAPLDDSYEYVS